jgi:D-3-phosphoglycerate dehydrogenase / 2-oxoglutarate reductase
LLCDWDGTGIGLCKFWVARAFLPVWVLVRKLGLTPAISKTSLDKGKIKFLLLEGIHSNAVDALQHDGYTDIDYHPKALAESKFIDAIRDAYFVGIRSATQLTRKVIESAPRLMGVGCFCIGTNQVDLDAAQERGIPVFNAPFSNTRSVAELVLAEIILLLRGIPQRNAIAHRGGWVKTAAGSFEVRGKRLGIIGYGHIGTQVGLLAESIGMQVFYYDVETKLALGNARAMPSLDALFKTSDVITLHVPETPPTFQMIGAAQLARMNEGVHLINASRGTVVDIDALVNALKSKHVAGAAVDVFPVEPKGSGDEFISPLRGMDNVILTPHVGGSTEEAQQNIGVEVAEKLIKYSNNGSTLSAVNFPQVSLPEHTGQHRLLHIHRNQPGVLSAINAIFSEEKINIAGQYLQTNAKIGYVVIDVETDEPADSLPVKRKLDEVEGTIRTRLLY